MNNNEIVYPELVMPDSVTRDSITFWSNGLSLSGDLFRPNVIDAEEKLPAIVLGHGWGGDKYSVERYAAKFAEARMIALAFTQNGWPESGSNIQLVGERPELDDNGEGVARVRFIDGLVDPLAWVDNSRAAVDYLMGEPQVDPERLGLWGTSWGGGTAVYHAANDPRIKALVVQVAMLFQMEQPMLSLARQRAVDIARGKLPAYPVDIDLIPGMKGSAHLAKMMFYDVVKEAEKLGVPTLMIDAGNEELFDISKCCGRVYEQIKAKDKIPVRYEIFPDIDHYGIYFEGFEKGSQLALDWFTEYL